LHLDYRSACASDASGANDSDGIASDEGGIVLYPHFQKAVVPGWLDKSLKWRHKSTRFLDDVVVLAPNPEWVATLPNGKLPDRTDFIRYGRDTAARVRVWKQAVAESVRLRDEFVEMIYSRSAQRALDYL
jgi:hypothetical protein